MKNFLLSNESKDNKKIENIKTNNINLTHTKKEKEIENQEETPSINAETIGIKNEDKNNRQKNEQMKKIIINLFNRYIPKNNNNKKEKDEENENENLFLNSIDNKDIEKLIFYKEQIHNLKDIKEKSKEDIQQQEDLKEKLKEIIMKYVIKLSNKKLINENKDEINENGNEIKDINIQSEEIMKLIFNNSDINQFEEEGKGEEEEEGEGKEEGELNEKMDDRGNEVENNSKNGNIEQDEKEDDNIISDNRRRKRNIKIRKKNLSIIDKMKQQLEHFDIKDKNEIEALQNEITSEEKLSNFFGNIKKLKNSIQNENIVQKIMDELFDENIEVERCQKKNRIHNFIDQIQNINNHMILKPKVNFLSPIKFSINNISKNSIK